MVGVGVCIQCYSGFSRVRCSLVHPMSCCYICVLLLLQFYTVSCLSLNDTKWVPKCCPIGNYKPNKECVTGGNGLDIPKDVLAVKRPPKCSSMYYLEPDVDHYNLFYNGTLVLKERGVMVPTQDFCLEGNLLNKTFVFVCFPPAEDNSSKEQQLKVYSVGLFISVPFIFATFLVYASIKKLRNLHGQCVKYHNLCLFLSYFLLGLLQNNIVQNDRLCVILGR